MSDAFRDVDPAVLVDLESEFQLEALYGGEVLLRQGDCTDSLFIVMSGRLRVATTTAEGLEVPLAELGAGETVGEMALLSGEPRSANVYAIRDSQLAKLSKSSVERLLEKHPKAMLRLLTGRLVARVRNMSRGERRDTAIVTVAVIPAGFGVPLDAFSEKLAAALGQLGRTRLLTSAIVDRDLGRLGASQAHDREGGGTRLLEWLAEQEVEHRYVVYQADPSQSPWTERCLRQADRIVILADATANPAPGAIESEWVKDGRARRSRMTLVLVHGDDVAAPTRTARWLHGRTLERHLHVRLGRAGDVARVARFLTGSAVGLALGGGFARGLAHLGVLRALERAGHPDRCARRRQHGRDGRRAMGSRLGRVAHRARDLHGARRFVRRHDDPVPLVQARRQVQPAHAAVLHRHADRGSVDPVLLRLRQSQSRGAEGPHDRFARPTRCWRARGRRASFLRW